jgi:hypothetical protein
VLRQALNDKGWTMEALSEHMGGKDKAYLHRVLSGDKPMPAGFFDELPHDAVGLFHARRAEAHGWLAVEPVDHDLAFQHLVVGLLSMAMRGGMAILPAKASRMAQAVTAAQKKKVG